MALTGQQVKQIRGLRADGHTQEAVAKMIGCSRHTVGRISPGLPSKVDNQILREAFLRSNMTAAEVAREIGWLNSRGNGDSIRLKRSLGISYTRRGTEGAKSWRRRIDVEHAGMIAEALGIGAWEVQ